MTCQFKDKALNPDQYYINYNAINNDTIDDEFEMLEDFESSLQTSQCLFPDEDAFQYDSEVLQASIFTQTQQPPMVNQRAVALDKELQKWLNTDVKAYIQCKLIFDKSLTCHLRSIFSYERK